MQDDLQQKNKKLTEPFRRAMYDFNSIQVLGSLKSCFAKDAPVHLATPFETMENVESFYMNALHPLYIAIPDLERREHIVISSRSLIDQDWVGVCGYYTGISKGSFLDIPPTGHQVAMRFHEFYRIEENQIIEMQALWDIPELMMQAHCWPMTPSLGREWHIPGPSTQDGLEITDEDGATSEESLVLVSEMLTKLGEYASGGVEVMQLDRYWHPRFSWYGPSGIGTCRGIEGFRNWHQIPFLNGMPDRVGTLGEGNLFAEGDYVGFTAWPGMKMTITGDGFLGIAPSGQKITMRSLDFWRCENGLIRENWVLVDLLHVYSQIGVDVLARMRELTRARDLCSDKSLDRGG